MTASRRLAAILAADVVGYSRLMQVDEAGTLAMLKSRRAEILQPLVTKHHGRIVKLMGDGVLVEFASAVNAVACALELQVAMDHANAGAAEDRRIILRIGINLGDVIVEGSDLYGDGVNIAARLEGLAEPGGVCVSGKVREEIAGKIPCAFVDLGEQTLKNMAGPMRLYRVQVLPIAKPDSGPPAGEGRITVAVLPFANMSGDVEQEYFADGLTEDLITALAKSRHLHVIARNTTFQYKGNAVSVRDVGRALDARYVLEGSLRRSANRIRVTAQLIDCASGAHLWAERFDRELADIFAVQDEIVQAIAAQLGFALIDASALGARSGSGNLTAYDHVLRGRAAWRQGAVLQTRDHFLNAVEADPSCAPALAFLAFFYGEDTAMQVASGSVDEARRLAEHYAEKAIAGEGGDAFVHHAVGTAYLCLGRLEKAQHHLGLAQTLNPYYPYTPINLGCTIAFSGRHEEGMAMIERALRLEPRLAPAMRAVPMYVHYLMHRYEDAIADFHRIDNPPAFLHLLFAMSLAQAGRNNDAKEALKAFEAARPSQFSVPDFARTYCEMVRLPEDKEQWREGLRKLGFGV